MPSCRKKAKQLFAEWKREGKLRNEEIQVITKDSRLIDVLPNVDTIRDDNGNPVHSLSTPVDIGFGNTIIFEVEEISYPILLEDLPAPQISAYPRETVVTEELQLSMGMRNTD